MSWDSEAWKVSARAWVKDHPRDMGRRNERAYKAWLTRFFDYHEEDCCCWSCLTRLRVSVLRAAVKRRAELGLEMGENDASAIDDARADDGGAGVGSSTESAGAETAAVRETDASAETTTDDDGPDEGYDFIDSYAEEAFGAEDNNYSHVGQPEEGHVEAGAVRDGGGDGS